jgi:UDP-3-O-[3-hydroxymyristoyl] glucosamine N-acyltransferase
VELTQLNTGFKINILKNGEFSNLGHAVVQDQKELLTFYDNEKFLNIIKGNKNITSIVCSLESSKKFTDLNLGIIISDTPRETFFKIHNFLTPSKSNIRTTIGKNSQIDKSSIISNSNVIIGKNVIIEENVIIRDNVCIGDNCIIRAGSIIGGEGFQYWKSKDNVLDINHYGKVLIGNNVELKEYCTVHLSVFSWDKTVIGDFTKIDSHCHIGHGNRIGKRVYLCSHANLSGNSIIEDEVYIGPGANIPNRLIVGKNSKISVGSTVTKNIKPGIVVSGNFAIPHSKYLQHIKSII